MKNVIKHVSAWCISLSAGIVVPNVSLAGAKNYLMWQLPTNVSYPVYVYSGGVQIDYLYSSTQQAFLGEYNASLKGTYKLYYKNKKNEWISCTFAMKNGKVNSKSTSCPGAVINNPVSNSNVYAVAFGAQVWPGKSAPSKPAITNYGNRKITFKNQTKYPKIQVGMICTKKVNPKNNNCKNTQNLFEIDKGSSKVFSVDVKSGGGSKFLAGLKSSAFTMTAYQICPNSQCEWVNTGGYGNGKNPYATKIEYTSLSVKINKDNEQIPKGATNFDVSAVDGYNISVIAYPAAPAYCTYTIPPENSNILGAGYYDSSNPLGVLRIDESVCKASSQLPTKNDGKPWDLTLLSKKNNFKGCMSPCTYARIKSNNEVDLFCCTGDYSSPTSCDQSPGKIGANNSTYVKNLKAPTSKHVYRYAFDDAIGDFACPAETDFVIVFK
ncbi:hypothetical protein MJO52_09630 [Microbulbifer variabilis]|uniref:Thaumatin domain-containing protein n=1 Tax=Microbulbifer variabilis TaxID=266805 RepID=A0ABY4VJ08_9GAMM|nr:thaumatin family protein [Microbulbifer variabilis]USD23376.1 hypothetical protein MJO52_09630 [Microbulbifer variabilis]